MTEQIQYRQARRDDLPAIAAVFLAAFPESVQHYIGHAISPAVMEDIFAICLDAEPQAFLVAAMDGNVTGYIFAPSSLTRVERVAIRHGHLLRIAFRWISGRYGIGWRPVRIAVRNWVSLLHESRTAGPIDDARILSIAVDPHAQGHGLGSGLLRAGLTYLVAAGVSSVRLEVRPLNAAAVHLYTKYGFHMVGKTRDSQGEWLIMRKLLAGAAAD